MTVHTASAERGRCRLGQEDRGRPETAEIDQMKDMLKR